MKIIDYITNYYCDEYKKDLHLYDFKDDSNLINNYKFHNKFHSVWTPKGKNSFEFIYTFETEEDQNKFKSKNGLNKTETDNFILFEEATIWTSLKYAPFNLILNKLGFPICECIETENFWWGMHKYPEYKLEKVLNIFDKHVVDSRNSEEHNLDIISRFLNLEGAFRISSTNPLSSSNINDKVSSQTFEARDQHSSTLNFTIDKGTGRSPEMIKATATLNSVLKGKSPKHLLPRR